MPSTDRMAGDDDRQLVGALRDGDEAAFASIVDRHGPTMTRVARAYVASDADAEEVVRDTWLAVLAGLESFGLELSFVAWIYRVLVDRARAAGAMPPVTLQDEPAVPEDRFIAAAEPGRTGWWARPPRRWDGRAAGLRPVLSSALDGLPPTQRVVVCLRDLAQLGSGEVSGLLDIAPDRQRLLLHRGRARLRAALESHLDDAVTPEATITAWRAAGR
jgi:RNA polymerase sigma-70 factor, ECF subfamily